MAEERKKLSFENLLSYYFKNFHKIILTNVLFAVPFMLVAGGIYFLTRGLGYIPSVVLTMLSVVICYPLHAGVSMVTRNIARNDDNVDVISSFFNAVIQNYKKFLLHGIVLYLIVTIGIFTFTFYSRMASEFGGAMIVLFITVILVALWVFMTLFYVPLMTVTFDLSNKYIYKNSALMALGEFKSNFISLFSMLVLTAIVTTPVMAVGGSGLTWLVIALTVAIIALIYPASCTYISNYFVQENMMMLVTGKAREALEESKEDKAERIRRENKAELEGLDIEKIRKSREEYIFHNGKMMKREVILRLLEEGAEDDE